MSGSRKEPKNEQQAAGHNQSSPFALESVLAFAYAFVGICMVIPITAIRVGDGLLLRLMRYYVVGSQLSPLGQH